MDMANEAEQPENGADEGPRYNNVAKNKSLVSFSQQMAYGAVLTLNMLPSLLASEKILNYDKTSDLFLLIQEFTRHFIPSVLMPMMFYFWSPSARKHIYNLILHQEN